MKRRVASDNWEQRLKREVEEFADGWSWDRVLRHWQRRVKEFATPLSPLFTTVRVLDPANPVGRETALSWWPSEAIVELHASCQRHFDRYPGTVGAIHPDQINQRQGELATLDYLWEHRDNSEKVVAILIAASLWPRLYSSRSNRPESWPPHRCVAVLDQWALECWQGKGAGFGWHYLSTEVVPFRAADYDYKIESMGALVRYLAEEHAALLLTHRPVAIEFVPQRDPFIQERLRREREIQKQEDAVRNARWERERAEQKAEAERLAREHPRHAEWGRLSNEELLKLVWTKPTTELAKDFGVSDVAISKRCRANGLRKPPVGFWAKVASGQIPHPNGQPQ